MGTLKAGLHSCYPSVDLFLLGDWQNIDQQSAIGRLYSVDGKVQCVYCQNSQPNGQSGVLWLAQLGQRA